MSKFWLGKKVLLTGHTGFKGAWLTLILNHWGAKVYGYALPAEEPSLYNFLGLSHCLKGEILSDISDRAAFESFYRTTAPDITIHMAAQSLVLSSYADPIETFRVNVLGTAVLLDVIRTVGLPQIALVVTTDKVYENPETGKPYTEEDPLGAGDPYSTSKACAELVTKSFLHSFWKNAANDSKIAVKTVRAGNVIGAGDWSANRLVPDVVRALRRNTELVVRYPKSVRPWQHVLEPLSGYLMLAEQTFTNSPNDFGDSFNFGPDLSNCWPTLKIVERLKELWGRDLTVCHGDEKASQPREATTLYLDSSYAKKALGWKPQWGIEQTLGATVAGYKAICDLSSQKARDVLTNQIESYFQKS